jgi:branched-chain amino acid transport system substrate-binding protein
MRRLDVKLKKLLSLHGKHWIVLISTLGALAFVMSCAPKAPAPVTKEPIKIGAILDYTGYVSDWGPKCEAGIKLALEEANYEVAGRPIEFIPEDGASDPTTSLDKLKELVEKDNVHICLGPLLGDCELAVGDYAAENHVLMTALYNGMTDLAPKGNWVIYPTTCYAQTIPMGWYAYDVLGYRTMVTVGSDFNAGHDYVNGAADAFKERGGTVVQQLWTPVAATDYSPYISTLEHADCLMHMIAGIAQAERFELQYLDSGVGMPTIHLTQDGHHTPATLAQYGAKLVGIIGESSYLPSRDDPINNAFVAAMEAKTGVAPGGEEQNSYVMAKVVLAALQATGGDDSFDKLWPAVLAVKMDTPQGPLSFDQHGIALTDMYVSQVQKVDDNYELLPIATYPPVTDPRLK